MFKLWKKIKNRITKELIKYQQVEMKQEQVDMVKYQYLEWSRDSPPGMDDSLYICCIFQLTSSWNRSLLFSNLGLGSQGIWEHGEGSFRPLQLELPTMPSRTPAMWSLSICVFLKKQWGRADQWACCTNIYGGIGVEWRGVANLFFCRHAQSSLVILMKEGERMGLYRTLIFPKSWLPSHLPFFLSM